MLKPTYPDLHCFAFAAPGIFFCYRFLLSARIKIFYFIGGLLCPEAAAASESFTLTVGLGDDLVMRLGVDSIENLRTDLLTAIRCCMLPKVHFSTKKYEENNEIILVFAVSSIVKWLHVRHIRSARPRLGANVGDC